MRVLCESEATAVKGVEDVTALAVECAFDEQCHDRERLGQRAVEGARPLPSTAPWVCVGGRGGGGGGGRGAGGGVGGVWAVGGRVCERRRAGAQVRGAEEYGEGASEGDDDEEGEGDELSEVV